MSTTLVFRHNCDPGNRTVARSQLDITLRRTVT